MMWYVMGFYMQHTVGDEPDRIPPWRQNSVYSMSTNETLNLSCAA